MAKLLLFVYNNYYTSLYWEPSEAKWSNIGVPYLKGGNFNHTNLQTTMTAIIIALAHLHFVILLFGNWLGIVPEVAEQKYSWGRLVWEAAKQSIICTKCEKNVLSFFLSRWECSCNMLLQFNYHFHSSLTAPFSLFTTSKSDISTSLRLWFKKNIDPTDSGPRLELLDLAILSTTLG